MTFGKSEIIDQFHIRDAPLPVVSVHIVRARYRQRISICPSVRHIPVFCPDEWRYDRAVFSFR